VQDNLSFCTLHNPTEIRSRKYFIYCTLQINLKQLNAV